MNPTPRDRRRPGRGTSAPDGDSIVSWQRRRRRRSNSCLHFHEDAEGVYADVKVGGEWQRGGDAREGARRVDADLRKTRHAAERYMDALENGTVTEEMFGDRVRDLGQKAG